MKRLFIIQSNYIPWRGYFDAINLADEVILYDDVQYTKNDWRNRNWINTQNGPLWLTIPITTAGKFGRNINEAQVARPNWGIQHWRTIQQSYAKAPYFKQYADVLEPLFTQPGTNLLSQINRTIIEAMCGLMGIDTPIRWSSEFQYGEGKTERLVKLCQLTGSTEYLTGPRARNYLDMSLFEEAGIRVHFLDYCNYPGYRHLYGPTAQPLSALDLIVNVGPSAKQYLKGERLIRH